MLFIKPIFLACSNRKQKAVEEEKDILDKVAIDVLGQLPMLRADPVTESVTPGANTESNVNVNDDDDFKKAPK